MMVFENMHSRIVVVLLSAVASFVRVVLWGVFCICVPMSTGHAGSPADEPLSLSLNGSDVNLRYGTLLGHYYAIDKCTDLDLGGWTEIFSNIAGTNSVQTSTDFNAGTLPKCFYRVRHSTTMGMSLIPAGIFQMGNSKDLSEGQSDELPVHSVHVSAFYMDKNLVSKAQWDEVANWATANGYDINAASASGKEANHPVCNVTWYACVKWSNARSQKEGLTPCYTVGGLIYKTGNNTPDCNLTANGYRLPTEAEWEKAARGGQSGKRFPWGDTISQSQANYYGNTTYSYDLGPNGYNPAYYDGVTPYTSPLGSFAPNGYGLYDMAGNLFQWCNDFYGAYGSGAQSDPVGTPAGLHRVLRGGCWFVTASSCRVSYRYSFVPVFSDYYYGFRCVRR